jgi:hypothetical protein
MSTKKAIAQYIKENFGSLATTKGKELAIAWMQVNEVEDAPVLTEEETDEVIIERWVQINLYLASMGYLGGNDNWEFQTPGERLAGLETRLLKVQEINKNSTVLNNSEYLEPQPSAGIIEFERWEQITAELTLMGVKISPSTEYLSLGDRTLRDERILIDLQRRNKKIDSFVSSGSVVEEKIDFAWIKDLLRNA